MLHELAELGMLLTRATVRRAVEEFEAPEVSAPEAEIEAARRPAVPRRDPAETFATLSRAVRLTLTLESRFDDALTARLAGEIAKCEEARTRAREDAESDPYAPLKAGRKARVRELVRDVADREIPDPEDHDILIDALEERLLCDEAYDNIDDVPLRDVVERLCRDLKLSPDWRRWTGEGWTPNPPFYRPRCSLFTGPSRVPILQDTDDPDRLE